MGCDAKLLLRMAAAVHSLVVKLPAPFTDDLRNLGFQPTNTLSGTTLLAPPIHAPHPKLTNIAE